MVITTTLLQSQHFRPPHGCPIYEQVHSNPVRNKKKKKREKLRLVVGFRRHGDSHTFTDTLTISRASNAGFGQKLNSKREGNDVSRTIKIGLLKEALEILHLMDSAGSWVDTNVYASLLQTCIEVKSLTEGMRIHAHMIKHGFKPNRFLSNALLSMYAKCGSLMYARHVFDEMPKTNNVSWTALIAGYVQNGLSEEALRLFYKMHRAGMKPNEFTFVSIIKACAELEAVEQGRQVHGSIIKNGCESILYVESALIDLYGRCGSVVDAFQVFDEMSERDVVSWTAMISGYALQEHGEEALKLFYQMQLEGVRPNQFTVASVLKACAGLGALEQGRQVHSAVVRTGIGPDVYVCSALVDMYAKCGSLLDARQVFDKMPKRNIVSWAAMIAGYAQSGLGEESLTLFRRMQRAYIKPDNYTFVSILRACACLEALKEAKQVHARIIKSEFELNTYLGSALVGLYGKCGNLVYAGQVFEGMPIKDVVSWTAMIAGYARCGYGEEALAILTRMLQGGVKANHYTFSSVLRACAGLEAVKQGKQIHGSINKTEFESNVFVGSALVDMYAKCGHLLDAHQMFDKMPKRNVVSWNVLITGYIKHGYSKEALKLLYKMQEAGMRPEEFIVISVLNACGNPHKTANNSIPIYSEMGST